MNVRKAADYSAMYAALDTLIKNSTGKAADNCAQHFKDMLVQFLFIHL